MGMMIMMVMRDDELGCDVDDDVDNNDMNDANKSASLSLSVSHQQS